MIVFPAVQEFIYFTNAVGPRVIEESQAWIRELYDDLNNKDIILITQDRGVDENLILDHTFEGHVKPKSFQRIDEMDFTMCLQGLKYHYIHNKWRFPVDKDTDFVYWGSDKSKTINGKNSGDERTNIIKAIIKSLKMRIIHFFIRELFLVLKLIFFKIATFVKSNFLNFLS